MTDGPPHTCGPAAYHRPHRAPAAPLRTCGPTASCGPAPTFASLTQSEPQRFLLMKIDSHCLKIVVLKKDNNV